MSRLRKQFDVVFEKAFSETSGLFKFCRQVMQSKLFGGSPQRHSM
jgi:hypothetical protein